MLDAATHRGLEVVAPDFATAAGGRELAWLRDQLGRADAEPIEVLGALAGRQPLDAAPLSLRAMGAWLEARITADPLVDRATLATEIGWLRRLARTVARVGEGRTPEAPDRFGGDEVLVALRAERTRLLAEAAAAATSASGSAAGEHSDAAPEVDGAVEVEVADVEDPLLGLGLSGLAVGGVHLGAAPQGDNRLPDDELAPEAIAHDPDDLADLPLGLRLLDLAPDDPEPDPTAVGLQSIFGDLDDVD